MCAQTVLGQSKFSLRTVLGLNSDSDFQNWPDFQPKKIRVKSEFSPRTPQTPLGLRAEYVGECKDLKGCDFDSFTSFLLLYSVIVLKHHSNITSSNISIGES